MPSLHLPATVENEAGQVFSGTYSEMEFGGTPNKRGLCDDCRMLGILDGEGSVWVEASDIERIERNGRAEQMQGRLF